MKSDTFSVNNSDIISGFIVVSCIFETEVLQAYTCDSIKKVCCLACLSSLNFLEDNSSSYHCDQTFLGVYEWLRSLPPYWTPLYITQLRL